MTPRLWHRFAALPAGLIGGGVGFVLWLKLLRLFVALDPHPLVGLLGYPLLLALVMGLAGLSYAAVFGWLTDRPRVLPGPLARTVLLAALLAYLSVAAAGAWWPGIQADLLILCAVLPAVLVALGMATRITAARASSGGGA